SRWWLGYRRSSLLHASILTRQSPPRSPRLQKAGAVLYSSARDVFIQRLFQFLQVPVTVLLLRHHGAALGPLIPRVDEQSRRGQPAIISLLQPAAVQLPKRLRRVVAEDRCIGVVPPLGRKGHIMLPARGDIPPPRHHRAVRQHAGVHV